MKNKDKVLKIKPAAISYQVNLTDKLKHWVVNIDGVCYASQVRESLAWSEAYRNIKQNG